MPINVNPMAAYAPPNPYSPIPDPQEIPNPHDPKLLTQILMQMFGLNQGGLDRVRQQADQSFTTPPGTRRYGPRVTAAAAQQANQPMSLEQMIAKIMDPKTQEHIQLDGGSYYGPARNDMATMQRRLQLARPLMEMQQQRQLANRELDISERRAQMEALAAGPDRDLKSAQAEYYRNYANQRDAQAAGMADPKAQQFVDALDAASKQLIDEMSKIPDLVLMNNPQAGDELKASLNTIMQARMLAAAGRIDEARALVETLMKRPPPGGNGGGGESVTADALLR